MEEAEANEGWARVCVCVCMCVCVCVCVRARRRHKRYLGIKVEGRTRRAVAEADLMCVGVFVCTEDHSSHVPDHYVSVCVRALLLCRVQHTSPPTRKPSDVSKPRATGVYSCL